MTEWDGLEEGDVVRVVGGLGDIDSLPRAEVVSLTHAGDNGLPTVLVEYEGCTWTQDSDCPICGAGRRHVQEWYPGQVEVLEDG